MSFCSNCGEELPSGAKFCKFCGTPVRNCPDTEESYDGEPESKPAHDRRGQKKKVTFKSIITTALITILGGVLIGFFGFAGGDPGSASEGNGPAGQSDISGMTDEEMALNGITPGPDASLYGSRSLRKFIDQSRIDTAALGDGFQNLDDISDEAMASHEDNLFGGDLKRWRKSYAGTWQSVGLYVTKYSELENLQNSDVASIIDRNMTPSENIRFEFNNSRHGTAAIWINGNLNVEGEHCVYECGNISITAPDTLPVYMWMYSTVDGVLFSYVYYVEDDGTEMASCIKFNRAR